MSLHRACSMANDLFLSCSLFYGFGYTGFALGESDVMWHWDGALDLGVNVDLSGFLVIG